MNHSSVKVQIGSAFTHPKPRLQTLSHSVELFNHKSLKKLQSIPYHYILY